MYHVLSLGFDEASNPIPVLPGYRQQITKVTRVQYRALKQFQGHTQMPVFRASVSEDVRSSGYYLEEVSGQHRRMWTTGARCMRDSCSDI